MVNLVFSCLSLLLSLRWAQTDILPPKEANFIDSQLPVFDINYINRTEWLGKPPKNTIKLQHPVDLVIIAHTVTSVCTTVDECSRLVRAMQNYHFDTNHSDILYNFLIGGDGSIYVGRGWDVKNDQKKQPSISVSFIGNFMIDYVSEEMIAALEKLMIDGVENKKLTQDYKIVAHNQTVATLSPGPHVYEVIQNLKHFKEGKFY